MNILIGFLLMFQAATAQVTLAWDANPDNPPSEVAGYNIYRSTQTGGYTDPPLNTTPITVLSFTDNPSYGKWYYVVKAVGVNGGLSLPSNEVEVNLDPLAPSSITLTCSADGKFLSAQWATVVGATRYLIRAQNLRTMEFVGYDDNHSTIETWQSPLTTAGDRWRFWVHSGYPNDVHSSGFAEASVQCPPAAPMMLKHVVAK